ncbi:prepilin-type N-terminal cleavage/methylation domain-containing protein [Almyronema epifaneia]|uniref:Prepilin-type N-terminal cleavage/methylation domain-containing protein n=1 Tax=Almyronema epifaneia S1 TaxID=2991925 RepID=A0ABW6IFP2_9CYAN
MSTLPSQLWLFRWLVSLRRSSKDGFTLLELLISIIIVGIIISGLLYLVVEMLQLDRREFVLNQVSTDMNRAIDYISSDVEEAIYVYSTPTDVVGELDDIDLSEETPILAFWRPDPLDQDDLDAIDSCTSDECDLLRLRQASLTLVVYLQEENDEDSIWNGETRIVRYTLPKYTRIAASLASNSTPGYADPLSSGNDFATWEANGTTDGIKQVLVDSVDVPSPDDITEADCPDADLYTRSPSTPADGKSFYVCVREATTGAVNTIGQELTSNQDLVVFLRGNATARQDGLINALSDASRLPTLQSRVLLRGVRGEEL